MSETARIARELFNDGVLFAETPAQTRKLAELVQRKKDPITPGKAREFIEQFILNPDQRYRNLFETNSNPISYFNEASQILHGLASLGLLAAERPLSATDRALYAQKLNWALFVLGIASSSEVSAGLYAEHFVSRLSSHDVQHSFLDPVRKHLFDFLKYRDFKALAGIEVPVSAVGLSEDALLALGLLGFMPVPMVGLIRSAAMSRQFFFKKGGVFNADFQSEENALILRHDHPRNPRIVPEELKSFHQDWISTFPNYVPKDRLGKLPSVVIRSPSSPHSRDEDRVNIGKIQISTAQGLSNPSTSILEPRHTIKNFAQLGIPTMLRR